LIVIGIDNFAEVFSELLEADAVEETFEDGVLDAGAKGLNGFLDTPKAFRICDVVADKKALSIHEQQG
jgi:hypothetical protein